MGINVLLVDDDINCLNIYKSVLEEVCNITVVSSAKEAIKELLCNNFHVIFLDLNMPNMNGYQFIEFLKKYDNFNKIPIIILSGENDDKQIKKAYTMGVKDYIVKPIVLDDLFHKIKYYQENAS